MNYVLLDPFVYKIWIIKIENSNIIKKKNIFKFIPSNCPPSLTVDSLGGYLFFVHCDIYSETKSIYKTHLDGSNPTKVFGFLSKIVKIFAVDYDKQKMFFLNDENNSIFYIDYNFQDTQKLIILNYTPIKNINSMFVNGKYVYISNLLSVWRLDKYTGANATKVIPNLKNASGTKVVRAKISHETEDTCTKNNGGCEEFCYARPQKYCSCVEGKVLTKTGHCLDNSKKTSYVNIFKNNF